MDASLTPSDIESWWSELDARESQTKIANLAAIELAKRYHSLNGGDKDVFEAPVSGWLTCGHRLVPVWVRPFDMSRAPGRNRTCDTRFRKRTAPLIVCR
jgi:hypothetical protein